MESLSRLKKNQNLRNEIENDREEALVSPALSSYAARLNKINPVLSSVTSSSTPKEYRPLHTKREEAYTPSALKEPAEESFNNSYIQDFLEEVKTYNLSKGYHSTEDTAQNILKPVQPEPKPFKPDPVKKPLTPVAEAALETDSLNAEIRQVLASDFQSLDPTDDPASSPETTQTNLDRVIEETQKIRVQLGEYEKGLVDMNQSVLSSNRILNIVVFVLVLVLMIMLGVAVYWVLYSGGFY